MTREESARILGTALICTGKHDVGEFYHQVFGWTYSNNLIIATDGEPIGRLVRPAEDPCLGWVPLLSGGRDDARSLSFRVDPMIGRELCTDVEGATFIRESNTNTTSTGPFAYQPTDTRPGHMSWAQLNTRSFEQAEHRYCALTGWTTDRSDNNKFTYRRFLLDSQLHAGTMLIDARSGEDVVPQWQLYFRVDDVAATAALIANTAGSIVVEPTRITGGDFAVALDPAGHLFAIDRMSHAEADQS